LEKKIPVILIRPRGGGQHSEKEWIDIEDLGKFYSILKEFVIRVHEEDGGREQVFKVK
jgi:di/tripeptidase